MRTAFAVALALSLSLAVVRANETPEPLFVDAAAPVVGPSSNTPAEDPLSNLAEPTTPLPSNDATGYQLAPAPPKPPKVCVMLKAESFEINTNNKARPMSAEPMAYLLCDNVTTTSSAGGATTLKCANCRLTLPNGVSAAASDVVFDTKTNLLTLTGDDKSPVTLSLNGTESKAAKVEMKIDPSSWRGATAPTVVPTAAYGTSSNRQPAPPSPARYEPQSR